VRFIELYAALDAERSWLGEREPLLYSALAVLSVPGDATAIATAIRSAHAELAKSLHLFDPEQGSVCMIVAAQLVAHSDPPAAFVLEVGRVRGMLRRARLREGGIYEVLAVLVLHRVLRGHGRGITPDDAMRFKAIYEQLKRHHWFLTGPDDYPACALLVGHPGTPEAIGAGVDAVYRALHRDADTHRGDPLQTAANMLYLTGLEPDEIARRFARLVACLREVGYEVRRRDYDELALLCFLATPEEKIIEAVSAYATRIQSSVPQVGTDTALSLSTALTFLQLVGCDARLGPLADAKLLMDVQGMVAATQIGATLHATWQ
jgi:hypothetical protein